MTVQNLLIRWLCIVVLLYKLWLNKKINVHFVDVSEVK